MTLLTPETEIALSEDRLASLVQMIRDLRKQIEALKQDAEDGGKMNRTETTNALSELNKVVLACTKTENHLDDCRNRQAGIARGGYALDLDKARADIGSKLDRIRERGSPGGVPE
ncbi:MAG: hypothetical protein WBB25_08950 [Sulfitobacter sp.]